MPGTRRPPPRLAAETAEGNGERRGFGRVTKKLAPGAPGTKRFQDRFGAALVCVRYRDDREGQRQYTTVELVVSDRTPTRRSDGEVLVRIDYREAQLRAQAKQAGATWDPTAKLWRMSRSAAKACGLAERIVSKKG